VAEDGVTDVLVFHARDYRDITGDPLYDPNRHARVQKLYWHPDGTPLFGVPVGDGGPIVRLSPGRHDFVRHDDAGVLVVARAPRDLAATQFRFEANDGGTEVIRSVDRPDLHVRIDGPAVRLDPTPTAFRRSWNRHGVTIEAEGGGYLHAGHGTITVAPEPTTFRLS
jgi:hypothetical protein